MNNFWRYLSLALLLFVGALAFIVIRNWDTVSLAWENAAAMTEGSEEARTITSPEELTAYLSRHPESVSLVSIAADGAVRQAHNADASRPLYRFPHLLLLGAATERMHDGRLDSTEQVPVNDVGAYALPGLTEAAHTEMMDSLRAQGRVRGEAVSLREVVRGMVTYQSPAAADWLMMRLGREAVAGLPDAYGLTGSEAPRPMSGTYVTWLRARSASPDSLRIEPYLGMSEDAYADTVWAVSRRLASDAGFRETVTSPLAAQGTGLSVIQQRDLANATFPRGTALDYARLLVQIYTGGPDAQAIRTARPGGGWREMQTLIETSLQQTKAPSDSARLDSMATGDTPRAVSLANVAGAYPGFLTLGGYLRSASASSSAPGSGAGTEEPRIVVLMMHDLPVAVFYQLAQTGIDKGLFLELLAEETASERVVNRLRREVGEDS